MHEVGNCCFECMDLQGAAHIWIVRLSSAEGDQFSFVPCRVCIHVEADVVGFW